ncbi:unnamed protein product [Ixodes hexagonus]
MRTLHTIQMRVEHQGRQLDGLTRLLCDGVPRATSAEEDALKQPFEDLKAFLKFDSDLSSDEKKRTLLLHQFTGLGGTSMGSATRNILEVLLSQKVAVNFSWIGQKGKRKFCELNVADIIYRAVKANVECANKTDVQTVIKVWLRHAGEKLKKLQSKAVRRDGEFFT